MKVQHEPIFSQLAPHVNLALLWRRIEVYVSALSASSLYLSRIPCQSLPQHPPNVRKFECQSLLPFR